MWLHSEPAGSMLNRPDSDTTAMAAATTHTQGTWCHTRRMLTEPVKCPCAQIRGGTQTMLVQLNKGT